MRAADPDGEQWQVRFGEQADSGDPMHGAVRTVLHVLHDHHEHDRPPQVYVVYRRGAAVEGAVTAIALESRALAVPDAWWDGNDPVEVLARVAECVGVEPMPTQVGLAFAAVAFVSEAWVRLAADLTAPAGPGEARAAARQVAAVDTLGGRYLLIRLNGGPVVAEATPGDGDGGLGEPDGAVFEILGRLTARWLQD